MEPGASPSPTTKKWWCIVLWRHNSDDGEYRMSYAHSARAFKERDASGSSMLLQHEKQLFLEGFETIEALSEAMAESSEIPDLMQHPETWRIWFVHAVERPPFNYSWHRCIFPMDLGDAED